MTTQVQAKVRFIEVTEEDQGQRLDNFLMRHLRRAPKSLIYRIVRKGEVRVNKKRAKVSQRIEIGDVVRIPPVRIEEKVEIESSEIPQADLHRLEQSILYEDNDLIVLNKPSGFAVHGGGGIHHGVIETMRVLRPKARRLELVHRIDRDTSGCLLLAKKASVLKALHQQIRDNQFDKRYAAIVSHSWPRKIGRVDLALKKEHLKDGGWHVKVCPREQGGKTAISFFSIEKALDGADLMAVKLQTGRTHQIRVHALAHDCALIGDDRYGDRDLNKRYRKLGMKRLALHARYLGFTHPVTDERMLIEAPLPNDFLKLIEVLDR
jgi:23S rRNA pseudouridine955/2504/2580 synthase